MSRVPSFRLAIWLCGILVIGLCLFGTTSRVMFDSDFSSILQEFLADIHAYQTQWLILSCMASYFVTVTLFQLFHKGNSLKYLDAPELWLILSFFLAVFCYALDYTASAKSSQLLTLMAGAALGKSVSIWVASGTEKYDKNALQFAMFPLVILLGLAAVWHTNSEQLIVYHGNVRWCGPWDNPNIYGLHMGTGVVLGLVLYFKGPASSSKGSGVPARNRKSKIAKHFLAILYFILVIIFSYGLLRSYSRGAWLGTFCGLGYLTNKYTRDVRYALARMMQENALKILIILISLWLCSVLECRQAHYNLAQRALSLINNNDFSWRNRVVTWEGAFQVIADHPWLGVGWNNPMELYNGYYSSSKIVEYNALSSNNFLIIGATLGIPALICFFLYIYLCLSRSDAIRHRNWLQVYPLPTTGCQNVPWLQAGCRAGAIVNIVGFCFDGGLFDLGTVTIFWILLELGRGDGQEAVKQKIDGNEREGFHTCEGKLR
jgi:O-antigen ligase